MSKKTKADLEKELEAVTARSKVLDGLLKYVCFAWASDKQDYARAIVDIGKKSSMKRKNAMIAEQVLAVGANKNLLKELALEGLGLPVDMMVFQTTLEHLGLEVENGENGLLIHLFRPDDPEMCAVAEDTQRQMCEPADETAQQEG